MSSSTAAPPLHEALTPLAWLVGTWRGEEGTGDYPTIKDFKYKEEVKFDHVGQPNLEFSFNSSHYETGKPLHREKGFLKIQPGTSHLAMVNTQNVGIVELSEGEVKGQEITLESHTIGRMTFGKDPAVTKIQRTFRLVDPDTLEQVVHMETSATTPAQHHLSIQYKKVA
ncbi:PREDICTED: THAP domain-containing protein 4-like isoform X1 [Branchiostoma belcheri]|uniref:THAP domain-containing protein 4-like isoform X1 n=1 Tax=Branchiostoma belcheri TaxID=7741 RepID=A0A6P5AF40_BRABE|nr:PREDICTED: THAP domain-containing protein 4-like isoform X1 [Branchiostoma belcheri]